MDDKCGICYELYDDNKVRVPLHRINDSNFHYICFDCVSCMKTNYCPYCRSDLIFNVKSELNDDDINNEYNVIYDNNMTTLLIIACKNSSSDDALNIINNESLLYLDKFDNWGCSALTWACKNNLINVAIKLIDLYIELNCENCIGKPDKNGNNAFLYACSCGSLDIIEKFLSIKNTDLINIGQINNSDDNALILICNNSLSDIAIKLIDITINSRNKNNCIKFNHVNNVNTTALIHACAKKLNDVALKLIKFKNVKIDQVDHTCSTAFIWACYSGLNDVANEILETYSSKEIKPWQIDNSCSTALIWACKNNLQDVALNILNKINISMLNCNQIDCDGKQALDYALENDMGEVFSILDNIC